MYPEHIVIEDGEPPRLACSRIEYVKAARSAAGRRGLGEEKEHMSIRRVSLMFLAAVCISHLCAAQEITVAAAADLQFAMQDVAARFQKETGKSVKLIYGSSGNFFEQIQNGAPFDMFFSANLDYPKKLEAAGLTAPGSYYQYATGKIVIWVPADSKLDLSAGLRALLNPSIKKIAIANPQHAPYGQAAVAAMQKENIYEKVKGKLVLGENISQTATFVVSGSADVGIVALSLALSPNMKDKGRYAEVPAEEYPPIEQACVIVSSSKDKETAKQFLSYIKTAAVADTLKRYGFDVANSSREKP
jgi:molybdate transport system substrate-binding protein